MSQFLSSTELFINVKNPPQYNAKKHFWDQSPDVLQFWMQEVEKITYGVNIGGYHIHPLLYWHINFFKTPIPHKDSRGVKSEPITNPPLDDNFLYFIENYAEAEALSKGLTLFGSRGVTKSSIIASLSTWLSSTKANGVVSINGNSAPDLNTIARYIKAHNTNVNGAFKIPTIKSEWESEVSFGVKEDAQNPLIHSYITITNSDSSKTSSSEKGAGGSPIGYVYDEIGKDPHFLKVFESAMPAFEAPYGYKLCPVLAGCVCAGTKVWNTKGDCVNIEDLVHSDGIIGYDMENGVASKEEITYWQKPTEKPCYRIITRLGRYLECSNDHPILTKPRLETETVNGKRRRKLVFKETDQLKVGDSICVIEEVDIWGDKRMWNPRLVGQLVGDGTYGFDSRPVISGCDHEITDYVLENFDAYEILQYQTKDNRTYKEIGIRGICKNLRELGIYGQTKHKKTLPDNIHSYCKKDVCEFIGGYFDADGHVLTGGANANIVISSCIESLMVDLQLLLQKLGIHGTICKGINKPNKLVKKETVSYILTISDKKSVEKFQSCISFSVKHKQDRLNFCVEKLKTRKAKLDSNYGGFRLDKIKSIEYIGMKPVYNLTAGNTNTYVAAGIITHNTSGNSELSTAAKKLLQNPDAYNMLAMDWDRLKRISDPDEITWSKSTKDKFGVFFPGQMSYRTKGLEKIDSNLADYLGIDSKPLKKISVKKTNWKKANELIQEKIDNAADEDGRSRVRMYYPREVADVWLTEAANPFPVGVADRHKRKLEDEGKGGRPVEIFRQDGKYQIEFSSKKPAPTYYDGGVLDSPIFIYGEFPTVTPLKYNYVGGLDSYKLAGPASEGSLGACYIIKRRNLEINQPCETIAASYVDRPDRQRDFNDNCEKLVRAFYADTCIESVDLNFQQHMDDRNLAEDYLCPAFTFTISKSNKKPSLNSRFGLYPTIANNDYRLRYFVSWCKEEHVVGIDDEGNPIIKLGVEFIDDIELLQEIIDYKAGGNFDRIAAFSHALVYAKELDKNEVMPERKKDINKEIAKFKNSRQDKRVFTKRRTNPF